MRGAGIVRRRGIVVMVAVVAAALVLGACGGDDDDDDGATGDQTSETTGDTATGDTGTGDTGTGDTATDDTVAGGTSDEELAAEYIGLTIEDAEAKAEDEGRPHRVIELDGESLPATQDFIEDRLNFSVADGVVIRVTTG